MSINIPPVGERTTDGDGVNTLTHKNHHLRLGEAIGEVSRGLDDTNETLGDYQKILSPSGEVTFSMSDNRMSVRTDSSIDHIQNENEEPIISIQAFKNEMGEELSDRYTKSEDETMVDLKISEAAFKTYHFVGWASATDPTVAIDDLIPVDPSRIEEGQVWWQTSATNLPFVFPISIKAWDTTNQTWGTAFDYTPEDFATFTNLNSIERNYSYELTLVDTGSGYSIGDVLFGGQFRITVTEVTSGAVTGFEYTPLSGSTEIILTDQATMSTGPGTGATYSVSSTFNGANAPGYYVLGGNWNRIDGADLSNYYNIPQVNQIVATLVPQSSLPNAVEDFSLKTSDTNSLTLSISSTNTSTGVTSIRDIPLTLNGISIEATTDENGNIIAATLITAKLTRLNLDSQIDGSNQSFDLSTFNLDQTYQYTLEYGGLIFYPDVFNIDWPTKTLTTSFDRPPDSSDNKHLYLVGTP